MQTSWLGYARSIRPSPRWQTGDAKASQWLASLLRRFLKRESTLTHASGLLGQIEIYAYFPRSMMHAAAREVVVSPANLQGCDERGQSVLGLAKGLLYLRDFGKAPCACDSDTRRNGFRRLIRHCHRPPDDGASFVRPAKRPGAACPSAFARRPLAAKFTAWPSAASRAMHRAMTSHAGDCVTCFTVAGKLPGR